MVAVFTVLAAVVGVILGGFVSRAAYALPRGEYKQILFPKCPHCGRELPAKYSIPVVGSVLSLRCPLCGEKQGGRALISELVLGAAFALLFLVYGGTYLFFEYACLAAVLLLLSLIDLDIHEILHSLLLVILVLGVMTFVFSFFSFSLSGTVWWEHLVGAFVISLPLFLVMMFTGGIGGGDVKLMFCLGLLLGYKLTLVTFLFGIVIAAVVAVILRVFCGKGAKYQLALVPFLSLGAMIALLVGEKLISALF